MKLVSKNSDGTVNFGKHRQGTAFITRNNDIRPYLEFSINGRMISASVVAFGRYAWFRVAKVK